MGAAATSSQPGLVKQTLPGRRGGRAAMHGCARCPGTGTASPSSWRGGNPQRVRKPGVWRGKTKLGAGWGDGRGPGRGLVHLLKSWLSFMAGMSPGVLEVWWPLGSGIALCWRWAAQRCFREGLVGSTGGQEISPTTHRVCSGSAPAYRISRTYSVCT